MKKPKKFLCLILAMVILIPNIALLSTAFAQTTDSEPLKIEVTTDKSSYTAYGIAEITVKVTNTSDEAVNNISAEAVFEQLAPVGKNNETFKEIESLQSGESFTFSYKATLNPNKVNINFFEKIILWFVRLFNGGYTATSHNIEADTENITEIKFGKYTAENVVKVGYKKILNNSEAYNQLIHNVNIDEVYQHNSENLSKDEQSGIEFTNNIIMIMFDWDCTDQRKADIINSVNGKVVGGITGYNELHIEIEKSSLEELEAICDKLNINDDIYASYDTVKHISNITGIPNDPWGITDDNEDINWENAFESSHTWSAVAIDAPGAWQYNDYFNTINIGIVDDGFSTQNKDLNLRVVSAENSPEDHGTKVAGIIGATANNNTGIAGVVWNKNIFAYDAKSSSGMYESDIYNGIETLVKRDCKVINLSIGSHEALNDKQIKREGKTASKKMAQLLEKGHDFIIVQAAGNGDSNYIGFDAIKNGNFCSVTSDNCYSNKNISKNDIMNRIIIVANSDRNFNTGSFVCAQSSNGGKQVDIAAPGANILSTTISTDFPYNLDSGTSMAAPFVTGVASLVWSVNSNFTGEEVKQIVLDAAEKGGVIVEDNEASPTTCDFYMVNAKLAVEEAINRTSPKITGTVKDSSTNEIIDKLVTIKIIDSNNIIVNHTKADKNGAFSVNVPVGDYTILIECEGYVSNNSYITVGNSNTNFNLGTILLKSNSSSESNTSSVHGTIIDCETRESISNVKVTLYSEDTQATYTTVTDESGAFNFENLTAGRYTLSFEHEDYTINETNSFTLDEGLMFVFTDPFEFTKKDSADGDDSGDTTDPNRTVIASGDCGANGDNVTWTLYDDGELVISGSGSMAGYYNDNRPWKSYIGNIKKVVITDGVKTIGSYAFSSCTNLTSVTIPNSVTKIGYDAFSHCTSLRNITIPDSVTSIDNGAFYGCSSISSIIIPDSVTFIGNNPFGSCKYLTNIIVDSNNLCYTNDEYGVLFNKDKTTLIQYPMGNTRTSYAIPASVTIIGHSAFKYCDNLTSVTIPGSVTEIDYEAFAYNCGLTSITIPSSVTIIDWRAFCFCDSLTSVIIGNGATNNGTTSIENWAFAWCDNLTEVIIGDNVTTIDDDAFYMCKSLINVTIGDNVTSIGDNAFDRCEHLTEVIISDNVTTIGDSAFNYCFALKDVYYSGTEVQWNEISIGSGNTKLTNATIHYNS